MRSPRTVAASGALLVALAAGLSLLCRGWSAARPQIPRGMIGTERQASEESTLSPVLDDDSVRTQAGIDEIKGHATREETAVSRSRLGSTIVSGQLTLEELLADPSNPMLVHRGIRVLHDTYSALVSEIGRLYPAVETISMPIDSAAEMSRNGGLVLTIEQVTEPHRVYVPCPPEFSATVAEIQASVLRLVNSDAYISDISEQVLRSLPGDIDRDEVSIIPALGGHDFALVNAEGEIVRRVFHNIPGYVRD